MFWLVFRIFMRGNFSSYICYCLKKRSIYQFHLNSDNIIFLVQVGDFCVHEEKNRFCKEFYISPYPKIAILLEIM